MLISTEMFVGADPDNDERFRELRQLSGRSGDRTSLALAMAGRIMTFVVNSSRVRDAMPLAAELSLLVDTMDAAPAEELEIIYTALAFARWANCEFAAVIDLIGRSLALGVEPPSTDRAVAFAIKGLSLVCLGDRESGLAHLRTATELARAMPPAIFSAIFLYWGILAGMGLHVAHDLLDEAHSALARAESFGDRFGIIAAQWTFGTLLVRSNDARRDEALELLQRAEEGIAAHRLQHFALAITRSQLAPEEARRGHPDDAIAGLRALSRLHVHDAPFVFFGCVAAPLCELLITRADPGDLDEVDEMIALWQGRGPGTASMDQWMHRIDDQRVRTRQPGHDVGQRR